MQLIYEVQKISDNGKKELLKKCDDVEVANDFATKHVTNNLEDNGKVYIVPIICNDDFSDPLELDAIIQKRI